MKKYISIIVVLVIIIGFIIHFKNNKKQDTVMQINQDIQIPTNEVARVTQVGDTVTVNYTGMFEDGKVFDTSLLDVSKKAGIYSADRVYGPYVLTLGAHTVISGWEEGLIGMKVGEKKHLIIPPEKAYGAKDYGPIPGNSTLIFDVELLAIK